MLEEIDIDDLERRMNEHTFVADIAVCVVTARELQLLLDAYKIMMTVRRGE